jgi:hypothetical protein
MIEFSQGDKIHYSGSLGEHDGQVAAVRNMFDENGAQLTAYDVNLVGLGLVRTSDDALSAAPEPTPASIEIPRSAYSDPTVPPAEQKAEEEFPPEEPEPGDVRSPRRPQAPMAELTAAQRDALPDSDFAIVRDSGSNKTREYPIDTRDRAVAALGRAKTNASPADQKTVLAAVCRRYSDLPACSTNPTALAMHIASKRPS